jgi:hypothetical protein
MAALLDWAAYRFWMAAPFCLRDTRLGWWLLPYAGRWQHRNDGGGE